MVVENDSLTPCCNNDLQPVVCSRTILRKIFEAMFIFNLKPNINDKEEKKVLERFLVSNE